MPIPIEPPIVTPAVPEKTFDQWFYANFAATNLHDPANATLSFDQVPQNAETKEFLWSQRQPSSGKFWQIVQNVPAAAAAMQAVIEALPAVKEYLDPLNETP